MMSKAEAVQPSVSKADIDWLSERLMRTEKRLRLILAILIDKKLIGEQMARSIEETVADETPESEAKLKWLLDSLK